MIAARSIYAKRLAMNVNVHSQPFYVTNEQKVHL